MTQDFAPQNVTFTAISLDAPQTRGKIDSVIQKRNFHLPIRTAATDTTLTEFKLGVLVPATLILDADGEIVGKIDGEASEKDIRSRLSWALNGH